MPASKVSFKTNRFDFEVENVEFTAGPEIVKVGHFKGSLDVADLLRIRLPNMRTGRGTGVLVMSYGSQKIKVIKATRNLTNWGLKEAKSAIESIVEADEARLRDVAANFLFIPTCGKLATKVPGLKDIPKVNSTEADMKKFVFIVKEAGGSATIERADAEGPMVLDLLRDLLSEALTKKVGS